MRAYSFNGYNFPERSNPNAGRLNNVMAKSVEQVHHVSLADSLDFTSMVNKKINK